MDPNKGRGTAKRMLALSSFLSTFSHRFRNSRSPPEKTTKNARKLSYDVEIQLVCHSALVSHRLTVQEKHLEHRSARGNAMELLREIFSTYQTSAIGSLRPASHGIREGSTYPFGMIRKLGRFKVKYLL